MGLTGGGETMPGRHPVWNSAAPTRRTQLDARGGPATGPRTADERRRELERRVEAAKRMLAALRARRIGRG